MTRFLPRVGQMIGPVFWLSLVLAAPMARADEDDCAVPMSDWQPRSAVEAVAKAEGWTLRRIRIDDGCYEAIGTDAQGRAMEAKLNPATLRVLSVEFEEEDDHGDDHGGDDRD